MLPCLPCKNPPPPPPGSLVTMATDWLKPTHDGYYICESQFNLKLRRDHSEGNVYLDPRCAYSDAAFDSVNEAIVYMIAISMTFPDFDQRNSKVQKVLDYIRSRSYLGMTHLRFGIAVEAMEGFSSRLIEKCYWDDWFKVFRENVLEARDKLIVDRIILKEVIRTKDFILSELVVKGERMGYFFDDRTLNLAVFAKTLVDLAREYKRLRVRPFDDLRKWPDIIRGWFQEISEIPRRKLCQKPSEPYVRTFSNGLLNMTLRLNKIGKDTTYTNGSVLLQFCNVGYDDRRREDPFQFKFVNNQILYSNKIEPEFRINRDILEFGGRYTVQKEVLTSFMTAAGLIASIYRRKYQKFIQFIGFEPF